MRNNAQGVLFLARLTIGLLPSHVSFATMPDMLVAGDNGWVQRFDGSSGLFLGTFVSIGEQGLTDVEFGPDGHLYVARRESDLVSRYDGQTGAFIDNFASGIALSQPLALTFGPNGDLFVAGNNGWIQRFDGSTGALLETFVTIGEQGLTDVEFGPDGNLYVARGESDLVSRYDGQTGAFIDDFASGVALSHPLAFTFGTSGDLFVAGDNGWVQRFDGSSGNFLGTFVSIGEQSLTDVEFGPDGNLYVARAESDLVSRYDGQTGAFIDDFASGIALSHPLAFTFVPEPLSLVFVLYGSIFIVRRKAGHA